MALYKWFYYYVRVLRNLYTTHVLQLLLSGYETHRNKDRNITKKRTTNVFTECEFIK